MNQSIQTLQAECLELLCEKLRIAETERDDLRRRVDRAESLCRPIRRAISELRKAQAIPGRKPAKRCADKQEVLSIARDVVKEAGTVSRERLGRLVADQLKERGRNRSMSAKLLAECLRAEPFIVSDTGQVQLITSQSPAIEGGTSRGTNEPTHHATA